MEPRPPRPRSAAGQPGSPYAPGARPPHPGPEPYAPTPAGAVNPADLDLVSRGERRRRGALRALGTLVLLALVGGGLWWFRDRLPIPSVTLNPPQQAASVTPAVPETTAVAALPNPPTAAAEPTGRPAVASVLATATATPPPAPTSTAAPTAPPAAAAKPTAAPEAPTEDAATSADDMRLIDLLPNAAAMPNGLVQSTEGERSKSEVVESLGGSDEASQLLDDWGWQGNAYREFIAPEGAGLPDGATDYINVSVHRFASPEAADNALTYFSDQVVAAQGMTDVSPVPQVGDAARALQGSPDGLPLVVLYVRDGSTLWRIGGSANSAAGDPVADVVAVAQAVVGGR